MPCWREGQPPLSRDVPPASSSWDRPPALLSSRGLSSSSSQSEGVRRAKPKRCRRRQVLYFPPLFVVAAVRGVESGGAPGGGDVHPMAAGLGGDGASPRRWWQRFSWGRPDLDLDLRRAAQPVVLVGVSPSGVVWWGRMRLGGPVLCPSSPVGLVVMEPASAQIGVKQGAPARWGSRRGACGRHLPPEVARLRHRWPPWSALCWGLAAQFSTGWGQVPDGRL
jgi:hypothetical protein